MFAPLTLASTVGGLDLMTNVAIAFPRNPIHLAHQAIDHQLLSGGRFTLGLGTPADIAAHIRDRVDGVADRICIYQPRPIAVESLAEIVDALKS